MSSQKACQHCGCSEIDRDPARGDAVCTNCGSVLEDTIIVSEIQFEENAHGGSRAIGQLVSSDGTGGRTLGLYQGKESRAITLQNARRKIVQVAERLRLNQHCIDTAFNFYKMALTRHLTRGRRNSHVVAACIYMVCRIEATPHMLLDLSDIVQVNVYDLGKTFLRLSSALCINIPAIDPCLYIVRFAHHLEFGEKTHQVSMTALRMVQRMKRDWMHTGRRPSGLCGAALVVAARLHDFHRTVKDLVRVVKVCETTIRKRLTEFGETPSSRLTLEEFMTIDLEEEQDPPCFKAARRVPPVTATREISKLQKQIERALEDRRAKVRGRFARYAQESQREEQEISESFIMGETLSTITECVGTQRPTAAALGLKESIEECMRIRDKLEVVEESGELDLEGLDEEELDSYIMTDAEVKLKTKFWTTHHAEYLKELKEKQDRKAEESESSKPEPKKRKRRKKPNLQANTAGEAIEKMLQEKRISSKINYDVLRSLSDDQQQASRTAEDSRLKKVKKAPPTQQLSSLISTIKSIAQSQPEEEKKDNDEPQQAAIEQRLVADDDDDDDFDEQQLSVAQLLGQHRGEQVEEYYVEDDYLED
ncbi:transcription factor IIIB 90 kDa subunit-like [Ornithodoros turicata]|uniref:B-related factor 1 n=1 Tax=Ornithodoros turicata TaxID=34597 RepID=A0A2R5LM11_9ACAR